MNILCKNKETFFGAVFLALGLYLLWEISRFVTPPEAVRSLGPDVFPGFLSMALCILSGALFFQGLRLPPAPIVPAGLRGAATYAPAVIFFGCCSFMIFIELLGFFIWSVLFLAALQYALGERRIVANMAISFVVALCMYLLFSVGLGVPMPRGPLPF